MSTEASPVLFSANFDPSCWGDRFLNIIPSDEATQFQMDQELRHLKEGTKEALSATPSKPQEQLHLIDTIERLGLGYHFETEIEEALQQMYESYHQLCEEDDLHHLSVRFRILRQHGFRVPCDVFNKFKGGEGGFKSYIPDDVRGMLSFYEACHVRTHDDNILDEALAFTTTWLKSIVANSSSSSPLTEQVAHALYQPLHKGMTRLESKHHMYFYEQDPSHNKTLLQFAKLDFNFVQKLHQKELRNLASWWKGVHAKLPFTRDRVVEGFFWSVGCYYEPQYALARKIFTQLFMIVQVFDDLFDAHGTVEELEVLTETVEREDKNGMTSADLRKTFIAPYHALLQLYDEVEQDLAPEERSSLLNYFRQKLKPECRAWLQEVKWRNQKFVPTYEEYMKTALVSVGQVLGIIASYLGMGHIASKEVFDWVSQDDPMPKIVDASHYILRLLNDIGGHKFEQTRFHVASSVQCYMNQYEANEEKAYEFLEKKVEDAWKDTNEGMLRPYVVPKPILDRILNLVRVPEVMYKGRSDGYTIVNQSVKDNIAAVLIDPVK